MSNTSGALTDIPELQFAELVAAARARLPALCPEWTDHGPADVGVTLIELFAWLTEMIRYRTRRETEATTRAFLELLAGPEVARAPDLALATRLALAELWTPYRAVTPDDYEDLARDAWPRSPEAAALTRSPVLHRVRCLPERDLEAADPLRHAAGHVSLVVLPRDGLPVDDALREALHRFFDPRRLLTTRHHVVGPRDLPVRVDAGIHLDDDVTPSAVRVRLHDALTRWLDPRRGGVDGDGWPLGGEVFVSDLYGLLDGVDGVDFVADLVALTSVPGRALVSPDGAPVGVRLDPHELVRLALAGSKLRLYEPAGDAWKEVTG